MALERTMGTFRATKRHRNTPTTSSHRILATLFLVFVTFGVALLRLHRATLDVHSNMTMDVDENAALPPQTRRTSNRIPISKLTTRQVSAMECPKNLILISDRIVPPTLSSSSSKIPLVIHQTSKSRCLVPSLADAVQKWKTHFPHYTYHFHDDVAVDKLLSLPTLQQTFPLLQHVALSCTTRGAMRADLWRYVLLYEYGGIYSDVDTYPNTALLLPNNDVDAYFVLEQDGLLSQYFMAVAPHHPLLFYTIQHTLINLLKSKDPRKDFAPTVTGPRALHQGFQTFCGTKYVIPDSEGQWLGLNHPLTEGGIFTVDNYTVRVDGSLNDTDSIIVRDAIPREEKKRLYQQMGMTYFMRDARTAPQGESCLALVRESMEREQKKMT